MRNSLIDNAKLMETAKQHLGHCFDAETNLRLDHALSIAETDITISSVGTFSDVFVSDSEESCQKAMSVKFGIDLNLFQIQAGVAAQKEVSKASDHHECCLLIVHFAKSTCVLQNVAATTNPQGHAYIKSGELIVGYAVSILFQSTMSVKDTKRAITVQTPNAAPVSAKLKFAKNKQTESIATVYTTKQRTCGGYTLPAITASSNESVVNYFHRISDLLRNNFNGNHASAERSFAITQGGLMPHSGVTKDAQDILNTILIYYKETLNKFKAVYNLLNGDQLKNVESIYTLTYFNELLTLINEIENEVKKLGLFSAIPDCIELESFKKYKSIKKSSADYLNKLKKVKLIAVEHRIIIKLKNDAQERYLRYDQKNKFCCDTKERKDALPLQIEFESDNALPYLDDGLNNRSFYLKFQNQKASAYLKVSDFSRTSSGKGAGVGVVDDKKNASLWQLTFIDRQETASTLRQLQNITVSKKVNYVLTVKINDNHIATEKPDQEGACSALQIEFEEHDLRNSFTDQLKNILTSTEEAVKRAEQAVDVRSERSQRTGVTQDADTQSEAAESSATNKTPASPGKFSSPFSPKDNSNDEQSEKKKTSEENTEDASPSAESKVMESLPTPRLTAETLAASADAAATAAAKLTWIDILNKLISQYKDASDYLRIKFIEKWKIIFLSKDAKDRIEKFYATLLTKQSYLNAGISQLEKVRAWGDLDKTLPVIAAQHKKINLISRIHQKTNAKKVINSKEVRQSNSPATPGIMRRVYNFFANRTEKASPPASTMGTYEYDHSEKLSNCSSPNEEQVQVPSTEEISLETKNKMVIAWMETLVVGKHLTTTSVACTADVDKRINAYKNEKGIADREIENFQQNELISHESSMLWNQDETTLLNVFLKLLNIENDEAKAFLNKIQSLILRSEALNLNDQSSLNNLLDTLFDYYTKDTRSNDKHYIEMIRGLTLLGTDLSGWIQENIEFILLPNKKADSKTQKKMQFFCLIVSRVDFALSHTLNRAECLGDSILSYGKTFVYLIDKVNEFSIQLRDCPLERNTGFRQEHANLLAAILMFISQFLNSSQTKNIDAAKDTLTLIKQFEEKYHEAIKKHTKFFKLKSSNPGFTEWKEIKHAMDLIEKKIASFEEARKACILLDDPHKYKKKNELLEKEKIIKDETIVLANTRADNAVKEKNTAVKDRAAALINIVELLMRKKFQKLENDISLFQIKETTSNLETLNNDLKTLQDKIVRIVSRSKIYESAEIQSAILLVFKNGIDANEEEEVKAESFPNINWLIQKSSENQLAFAVNTQYEPVAATVAETPSSPNSAALFQFPATSRKDENNAQQGQHMGNDS